MSTHLCAGDILLEDHFERQESNDAKEDIGNGWSTNSRTRAAGNKQADLDDGALYIYRHAVADHGVSVVHEAAFKDAKISLRFKIGDGDELGINIADMNEKSVHAGHLCVAKIRLGKLTLVDLKTGRMDLGMREKSQAKTLDAADKKLLADKEKSFPIKLDADTWYQLELVIDGPTMTTRIDGKEIGAFSSPGIDHATKSRLRLAVAKNAWVDDVMIERTK
ncbi:MAG: hypothetical protein KDB00_29710 [Planctomycetales bacterium]|nr:hypothetical protein [Planctomycetales bacterium]